jgi:hypothetical protein
MSTVIQSVMAEIIWACGEKAGQGQKPKTAELDLNSSSKVSIMVVAHRQKHTFRETLSRSTSRQMGYSVDHERKNFTANPKHKKKHEDSWNDSAHVREGPSASRPTGSSRLIVFPLKHRTSLKHHKMPKKTILLLAFRVRAIVPALIEPPFCRAG